MSKHRKSRTEIEKICSMINAGRTNAEIALVLNLPEASISRFRCTYNMTPDQVAGYLPSLTSQKSAEIRTWMGMQKWKRDNGISTTPAQMPLPASSDSDQLTGQTVSVVDSDQNERLRQVEQALDSRLEIVEQSIDHSLGTVNDRLYTHFRKLSDMKSRIDDAEKSITDQFTSMAGRVDEMERRVAVMHRDIAGLKQASCPGAQPTVQDRLNAQEEQISHLQDVLVKLAEVLPREYA